MRLRRRATTRMAGEVSEGKGKYAYTHMTLWAENNAGLHNLFRLSSLARLEGYYRHPRFDRDLLDRYGKGLIGTTGCPSGEVNRWLQAGNYDKALATAADIQDILGKENYFCELMDHGIDIERRYRDDLLRIAKTLDLPFVATNDTALRAPGRLEDARRLPVCRHQEPDFDDPKRFRFDQPGFLHQVRRGDARKSGGTSRRPATTPCSSLNAATSSFNEGANLMPRFPVPEGESEESWLVKEVERGLAAAVRARIRFPRRTASRPNTNSASSLRWVTRATSWSSLTWSGMRRRTESGSGPGRGSAAGALIAWALGITELDPMQHGLLFERFLNPERVSMPDIDIDFDERRRGEMIRYATEQYGDRIGSPRSSPTARSRPRPPSRTRPGCWVSRSRSATGSPRRCRQPSWARTSRCLGSSTTSTSDMARRGSSANCTRPIRSFGRSWILARGLEGLKRQVGVHAAGVIMSSEPLMDVIPLWRRDDGSIITQFDMGACETLGSVEDGLPGPAEPHRHRRLPAHIKDNSGIELILEDLPLDDRPTYELLARGDTLGVFQLDGGPMRSLLRSMVPDNFEDISAVLALYRPGPMGANAHNDYADRKNGRKPVRADPPGTGRTAV